MLAVVSPAKKIDFSAVDRPLGHGLPVFLDEAQELVDVVKVLSRTDLIRLMKISDKLADLNYQRFRAFSTPFDLSNAKQAALAFSGDTYVGLDAKTLDEADFEYAQDHFRILSGLYGLLRPLDLIQPYRLEMGTRLNNPRGGDLYDFWGTQIAEAINQATGSQDDRTLVNLASNEYFKAVKRADLAGPVLTPVFKEIKDGESRTLGMFAKRARGMMARFMIQNRIDRPEGLKDFVGGGYAFRADVSDEATWIFTRQQP